MQQRPLAREAGNSWRWRLERAIRNEGRIIHRTEERSYTSNLAGTLGRPSAPPKPPCPPLLFSAEARVGHSKSGPRDIGPGGCEGYAKVIASIDRDLTK